MLNLIWMVILFADIWSVRTFFLRNHDFYVDWLGFVVVAVVRDEHRFAREWDVVARLFHTLVFSFLRHICCPAMFDAAIAWLLLMCLAIKRSNNTSFVLMMILIILLHSYTITLRLSYSLINAFLMQGKCLCLFHRRVGLWSTGGRMNVAIWRAFVGWSILVNQPLRLFGLGPVLTTCIRCHSPTVLEALVPQCQENVIELLPEVGARHFVHLDTLAKRESCQSVHIKMGFMKDS